MQTQERNMKELYETMERSDLFIIQKSIKEKKILG